MSSQQSEARGNPEIPATIRLLKKPRPNRDAASSYIDIRGAIIADTGQAFTPYTAEAVPLPQTPQAAGEGRDSLLSVLVEGLLGLLPAGKEGLEARLRDVLKNISLGQSRDFPLGVYIGFI